MALTPQQIIQAVYRAPDVSIFNARGIPQPSPWPTYKGLLSALAQVFGTINGPNGLVRLNNSGLVPPNLLPPSLTVVAPVQVATDATLPGGVTIVDNSLTNAPDTIDGVALLEGYRVLVKDQADPIQNGIYVVDVVGGGADGEWSRADDLEVGDPIPSSSLIGVQQGTVNADLVFLTTGTDDGIIGTDPWVVTAFPGLTSTTSTTVVIEVAGVSDPSTNRFADWASAYTFITTLAKPRQVTVLLEVDIPDGTYDLEGVVLVGTPGTPVTVNAVVMDPPPAGFLNMEAVFTNPGPAPSIQLDAEDRLVIDGCYFQAGGAPGALQPILALNGGRVTLIDSQVEGQPPGGPFARVPAFQLLAGTTSEMFVHGRVDLNTEVFAATGASTLNIGGDVSGPNFGLVQQSNPTQTDITFDYAALTPAYDPFTVIGAAFVADAFGGAYDVNPDDLRNRPVVIIPIATGLNSGRALVNLPTLSPTVRPGTKVLISIEGTNNDGTGFIEAQFSGAIAIASNVISIPQFTPNASGAVFTWNDPGSPMWFVCEYLGPAVGLGAASWIVQGYGLPMAPAPV